MRPRQRARHVWPLKFSEVKATPPPGHSVSSELLKPAILIDRGPAAYTASVVGLQPADDTIKRIPLVRPGANYVVDEDCISPLPSDINGVFQGILGGRDAGNLSYSTILALGRSTDLGLPVVFGDAVFESANHRADQMHARTAISGLNATLFPYQEKGVAWMHDCLATTGGLILADEMGLGKTIQIIALLLLDPPEKTSPALVVCPTSLLANWVRELGRFAPNLTALVHRGPNRTGSYKGLQRTPVVITTYDTLLSDVSIIRSVEWSFVIADEAQAIKNPRSQRRQAIIQAKRRRTIAVTGTPVENTLKDLWSLADFVIPGILGTESEFDLDYANCAGDARQLSRTVEPVLLRRKLADVASELPKRIDSDVPIELGDSLALEYEAIRKEVLEKYPVAGALVATGQLQLFCAHPWLRTAGPFVENWEDRVIVKEGGAAELLTPKMERAVSLIQNAFSSGRKVLLFSLFNGIGRLVRKAAADLPPAFWASINGSTEASRRQEIVDEFSAHKGPAILILNPKAAGTGLNITAATVVIHYTQVWNPAMEAQASARAHRRGQELPVNVYRLYYEDTVERVMIDRTRWKSELANDAVPVSTRDRSDLSQALSISPNHRKNL